MNRKLHAGFLLALAIALSACAKQEEEKPTPIAPVQVAPVGSGTIRRLIQAEGVLQPADQSIVVPKSPAPIQKFYVNRGDHVKAGPLVATLESRDLAATAD